MKTCSFFIKKCALLLCIVALLFEAAKAQPAKTEILWDNWGVPHIYGKTTAGMYYAFGWAQMHNHADLILQLYGEARGRAAEYWGKNFLQGDEIVQKLNLTEVAQKVYDVQHPEYKTYLDAFVKGITNKFCRLSPRML
jgi:acyl-homoserine-lactone acylase